jgi:response regulator RpfG family c-di-GMP phosphodiesterase
MPAAYVGSRGDGMESVQTPGRVLLVDDEPSVCQLLNDALLRAGYQCQSCSTGEEALNVLKREPFDIVITDLYMPGLSGMSLLEQGSRVRPESAFLLATGESDARVGVEAMKNGAADYLVKPFPITSLMESVRRAQQKKRRASQPGDGAKRLKALASRRKVQLRKALEEIDHLYDETVETLGAALDLRDNETAGHAQRVCRYTVEIGRVMGFSGRDLKDFARGSLLHDIGKIGIPDEILLKPAALTDQEAAIMRTHVMIGYNLIQHLDYLRAAAEMVLCHHERFDGCGYPHGLAGPEIPIGARIFSVADMLDAMTTDRPYRQACSLADAKAEITSESGRQLDPEVVAAFLLIPEETLEMLRRAPHARASRDKKSKRRRRIRG